MTHKFHCLFALLCAGAIATEGKAGISASTSISTTLSLEELAQMDATVISAQGGMLVGANNDIVPDASSEHPLVIAHPEDQPLCKPSNIIPPSQPVQAMEGYETFVLANVENPQKIVVDQANHVLVVSGGKGLYSIRSDKCGNAETLQILNSNQLGEPIAYGVALFDNSVYVTTANSVWRFPYVDGQHTALDNGFKVLTNISPNNPNAQPDIAIDPFGHAYVPRQAADLTEDPKQAIIKRFNFRAVPSDGYDYETDGEVYAFGTNVFGAMAFDAQARLWGIDRPYETFQRADLGGNLSPSGIAEEINVYEFPYKNYGFPYCFTEYDMKSVTPNAKGKGAQWGHPYFMNSSVDLDSYCQSDKNVAPAIPLEPNVHASGIFFYMGTFCSVGDSDSLGTSVGLPCNWTDTPLVAYHGAPGDPNGHSVVHLQFDDLGHQPRWDKESDVVFHAQQPCTPGQPCVSPSSLAVDKFGRLLISSDETNEIFLLYRIYNEHAARILTDKDNAKQAREDALEEAKEAALEAASEGQDEEEEEEEPAAHQAPQKPASKAYQRLNRDY